MKNNRILNVRFHVEKWEGKKKCGQFVILITYLPSSPNKIYMILNNVYLNRKIKATKYQKLKSNVCLHQLLQHSLKTTAHFNYTHKYNYWYLCLKIL